MRWRHALAIAATSGALLIATAPASGTPPRAYTFDSTQACLGSVPGAVLGMPPASPPVPAAFFFTPLPADQIPGPILGRLAAWSGGGNAYQGVTLSFFTTAAAARHALKTQRYTFAGGTTVSDVIVNWDQKATSASFRKSVTGCLESATPGGPTATAPPAPAASLPTFAGQWGGHTRGLTITPAGRGLENVDDGCCNHEYKLVFQIVAVSGTLTHATATYRVLSFTRYDKAIPAVPNGAAGKLQLQNGIVTNTLTRVIYCSDPAWGATGACGA